MGGTRKHTLKKAHAGRGAAEAWLWSHTIEVDTRLNMQIIQLELI